MGADDFLHSGPELGQFGLSGCGGCVSMMVVVVVVMAVREGGFKLLLFCGGRQLFVFGMLHEDRVTTSTTLIFWTTSSSSFSSSVVFW